MKHTLSPKKYIETQARKLPIYKCLVNEDWEGSRMADVVVMRQHINGNITLGLYLVDLLCLGIKDTYYKFNIPQSEAEEQFGDKMDHYIELDYELAHNIVYAGHDFAMEFEIPPHKDFSLTKNILEEDNDSVPLIEIPVGDKRDGKPHLVINPYGQGKWALEKLIKNAGEDNYYYTTEDDIKEADDSFAESRTLLIEDYEMGTIGAYEAIDISTEELLDPEKIMQRDDKEKLSLTVEGMIRIFEVDSDYSVMLPEEFITTPEYAMTDSCDTDQINFGSTQIYIEDLDEEGDIEEDIEEIFKIENESQTENAMIQLLDKYPSNLFALTEAYKIAILNGPGLNGLRIKICGELNNFTGTCPLAKLFLAFDGLYNNIPDLRFANIQYSKDIQSCFPGYKYFGNLELQLYWLIKSLKNKNDNDLEKTIFYYQLAVETLEQNEFLLEVQLKLIDYFTSKIV
jgi:hypothetical protein